MAQKQRRSHSTSMFGRIKNWGGWLRRKKTERGIRKKTENGIRNGRNERKINSGSGGVKKLCWNFTRWWWIHNVIACFAWTKIED